MPRQWQAHPSDTHDLSYSIYLSPRLVSSSEFSSTSPSPPPPSHTRTVHTYLIHTHANSTSRLTSTVQCSLPLPSSSPPFAPTASQPARPPTNQKTPPAYPAPSKCVSGYAFPRAAAPCPPAPPPPPPPAPPLHLPLNADRRACRNPAATTFPAAAAAGATRAGSRSYRPRSRAR
ncbi:hypothetical protein BZA05DRAFT_398226 [Tricharina praecox]|uniref:uncharacterized protein n=1 Tax=Tricharina praecox TaxID=43433 RepID=UPI00221F2666|nr:uncharacterized protein BZA05DRAFT_398226 [Tricharina praecox]KAI5851919.1 hypothetical protein BZA05DRAFT_398226 [Tricharina praecox]